MHTLTMLGAALRPTVLITRPYEDARILAKTLSNDFPATKTLIAPVMAIEPVVAAPRIVAPDLVLLTSRHAVPSAVRLFPSTDALCVGDATARSARAAGLNARSVSGTADDLIAAVKETTARNVVRLRGKHTRGDVAERLRRMGRKVEDLVVYAQREVGWDDDVISSIAASPALVVPLFSPRNAHLVGTRLAQIKHGELRLVCISKACADAWGGPMPMSCIYVGRPDLTSMLRALGTHIVR